ncbi:Gp37-like protein [Prescottella equi]
MSRKLFAQLSNAEEDERRILAHPRAKVRFLTKRLGIWGPCGEHQSLKFTDKKLTPGSLSILVPENDHWVEYFYGQPKYAMRPIVIDLPGYRTFWLTVKFGRVRRRGKRWIQVEAVHGMKYFDHIRMWPAWESPAELQPESTTAMGHPVRVLKNELAGQLFRLQAPGRWIPRINLLNMSTWRRNREWFWPLMINPRNTIVNRSAWTITDARMDKFSDVMVEVCKTENIVPKVDLYIHGEDPQPFPEFIELDRNTLIVDFVEKPPTKPVAHYPAGKWSPATEVEQLVHMPMASRITGGGKSPGWMNDIVINAGNFIAGAIGVALGVAGLSLGVLTDQLKNKALAFHSVEDKKLAEEAGPLRFHEAFITGTALSLDLAAAIKSTAFDHRGYTSQKIVVTNGTNGLYIGRDLEKGDHVSYDVPDGTTEVDSLEEIEYEESPSRIGFRLQIGSGEAEREPGALALAKLRKFTSTLTRAVLGG